MVALQRFRCNVSAKFIAPARPWTVKACVVALNHLCLSPVILHALTGMEEVGVCHPDFVCVVRALLRRIHSFECSQGPRQTRNQTKNTSYQECDGLNNSDSISLVANHSDSL